MDKRFISAFGTPCRIRLLGRDLTPFCLRHRVALIAIDSPFITGARPPTPSDLILALQVCSGSVIGDFTLRDSYWKMRIRLDPQIYANALASFTQYVGLEKWPKFWEMSKKTESSDGKGIPWILGVVGNLVSNGITEERAWLMPEYQAIWLSANFSIANGSKAKLLTTEEEEFMASLDGNANSP